MTNKIIQQLEAEQMTKELSNNPQSICLVAMYRIVVSGKGGFEQVEPHAI